MLMASRDNEMVDGYSNVACEAAQEAEDGNGGGKCCFSCYFRNKTLFIEVIQHLSQLI